MSLPLRPSFVRDLALILVFTFRFDYLNQQDSDTLSLAFNTLQSSRNFGFHAGYSGYLSKIRRYRPTTYSFAMFCSLSLVVIRYLLSSPKHCGLQTRDIYRTLDLNGQYVRSDIYPNQHGVQITFIQLPWACQARWRFLQFLRFLRAHDAHLPPVL
ncbi:hypothetical protein J3R30DRAFT_1223139 [Lentinula aciculospora]|uniref:Uncharacterized protein n=1 Tax=Lentinula aciculospora TaxID=153920 RepID=A0A9W9DGY9_9AGAR|nr:hypothetical protein J3R30DRAFT_1223139 [Lentinula aciculospora]